MLSLLVSSVLILLYVVLYLVCLQVLFLCRGGIVVCIVVLVPCCSGFVYASDIL